MTSCAAQADLNTPMRRPRDFQIQRDCLSNTRFVDLFVPESAFVRARVSGISAGGAAVTDILRSAQCE